MGDSLSYLDSLLLVTKFPFLAQKINNYSLKSRWIVAEYLPSPEVATKIPCLYSPGLKRIAVLLHVHKVIQKRKIKRTQKINNYSLKSRWIAAEYLPSPEVATKIPCLYSPGLKRIAVLLSPGQTIATCQRNISQYCWGQQVACVWPPCSDMLGVVGSILTSSNLSQQHPTRCYTSQHGGQTHATCCAQQCCDMLRWHVAIVWPGLYMYTKWSKKGKSKEIH